MNYLKNLAVAAVLAAAPVSAASAAPVDFGANLSVTGNAVDPGLVVNISGVNDPLSFTLDSAGGSASEYLFSISTPEATVNGDDLIGKAISVQFTFFAPGGAEGTVSGMTGGATILGIFQNGYVDFDNTPVTFDFGSQGTLDVSLNDVTFGAGFFGLTHTPMSVYGNFTYSGQTAAVPEAATWAMLITGFGAVGINGRRRRGKAIAAA